MTEPLRARPSDARWADWLGLTLFMLVVGGFLIYFSGLADPYLEQEHRRDCATYNTQLPPQVPRPVHAPEGC